MPPVKDAWSQGRSGEQVDVRFIHVPQVPQACGMIKYYLIPFLYKYFELLRLNFISLSVRENREVL